MEVSTFSGRITDKEEIPFALRKEDDPRFSIYIKRNKWSMGLEGPYFGIVWKALGFHQEENGNEFHRVNHLCQTEYFGPRDFRVDNDRVNLTAVRLAARGKRVQVKSVITLVFSPWNSSDEAYFQTRNKISCDELQDSCYLPVLEAEIITEIKRYIIYERTISPIYAIWFPTRNYKIY